nr:hypothetical protein [Helicobacter pylori]
MHQHYKRRLSLDPHRRIERCSSIINIKTIAFGSVIKLNPHNRNPLLKPYSTFIALSCTQFHYSGMHLVAPYENDSIIFELLHCIDFQARNFERQQLVQLDPKEIKTQILERLKL